MSSNDSSSSNSSSFNNGQGQANVTATNMMNNPGINAGYWHQDLELFFICFCCFFIVVLIIGRTWIRRKNTKSFTADDYWILSAAFLTIPYWVCQVGTNQFGSGLHIEVVPASDGKDFLGFERGWAAYYFITSMIKVSELLLILGILPMRFRKAKIFIYVLCVCIMSLGLALSLAWFFQCEPVASNFDWTVTAVSCIDFGPPRYAWVGFGICFDVCITAIPILLLRRMMLKSYERMVLMLLFSANALATIILIAGLAGIYYTSDPVRFPDYTWLETIYIIMQNLETLAYTLGASAPVFYRFLVKPGSRGSGRTSGHTRSWRLRKFKNSDKSGETAQSDGTAPPSYHSDGTRKGSLFKPSPTYPGVGHEARGQDFSMTSPVSPEFSDREKLNSSWKPLPAEP